MVSDVALSVNGVRCGLVLFLCRTLLGLADDNIVDVIWLCIVENLDLFKSYPWGNSMSETTHMSIVQNMQTWTAKLMINTTINLSKNNDSCILRGRIYFFYIFFLFLH